MRSVWAYYPEALYCSSYKLSQSASHGREKVNGLPHQIENCCAQTRHHWGLLAHIQCQRRCARIKCAAAGISTVLYLCKPEDLAGRSPVLPFFT